jgi:RNA polymerase sigma-70 factor (ECF subfamily)
MDTHGIRQLTAARDGMDGQEDAGDVTTQLLRLQPALRARAAFLTQDQHAADDLVQDVIERALVAQGSFQHGTNLQAWLNRIMRNLFIDGCRRRLPRRFTGLPADDPPEAQSYGPVDLLSWDDVLDSLAALSATEREIFTMAYLEHRSYQEIARRLGIAVNTTGTRLYRIRAKLRRILGDVFAVRRAATLG